MIRNAIICCLCIMLNLCILSDASGGWPTSEEVIISGIWGTESSQFGLKRGDTIAYDEYPDFMGVDEGEIVIHDSVNRRFAIYGLNGGNVRYEQEKRTSLPSGGYEVERSNEIVTGWIEENGKYVLYDALGVPVTTSPTRPLELGKLSVSLLSVTFYKYEIEYPDAIYVYEGAKDMLSEKGMVRIGSNIIMQNFGKKVYAYKVISEKPVQPEEKKKYKIDKVVEWTKPDDQGEPPNIDIIALPPGVEPPRGKIIAQYGDAYIGSDGSIYTWMRSETNYKMLRWRWVE